MMKEVHLELQGKSHVRLAVLACQYHLFVCRIFSIEVVTSAILSLYLLLFNFVPKSFAVERAYLFAAASSWGTV